MLICLCSSTLSQISLKNSFGKAFFFFKFWSRYRFREMEISILAAIFKTVNVFQFFFLFFFCWFMVVSGVYRYGASFVLKFFRESTFLRLGPSGPPPHAQTGVQSTLQKKKKKFIDSKQTYLRKYRFEY